MKNAKQVLLLIGCLIGAYYCGYLMAVSDISVPLTGTDLTSLSEIEDMEPRNLQGGDIFAALFHTVLGNVLLMFAVNIFLKLKRGQPTFPWEKFRFFVIINGSGLFAIFLLGTWLRPDIESTPKTLLLGWIAALALLLAIIELRNKVSTKRPDG